MNRRDVIKSLSLLPATGIPFAHLQAEERVNLAEGPLTVGPKIFQSIGVEPLINCMGTFTIIGGSLERPQVRAAMEAASKNFVQYDELAYAVGTRLGEITKAEFGMVSAGCAAGLKHVAAACLTGGDPEKLIRIPNLTGFDKTEVVSPRSSRNVYDHAIRNTGAVMVTVDTMEELERVIGPKTAMVYLNSDSEAPFTVEAVAKIANAKNVPLLVDAAAEDLTVPCVHLEKGATIVAYSGGKALCGPQCAGIVLGKKDILQSAWQASSPHHGPGRDNKVGREEMIGALAAVETWVTMDHKAQWEKWLGYLSTVQKKVEKIEGVKTSPSTLEGLSNNSPGLVIAWNADALNITGEEVAEILGRSKPRIALAGGSRRNKSAEPGMTMISVKSGQMQPGEDKIVAERIFEVLSTKREAVSKDLKPTTLKLTGRWDVTVEFYSSKVNYGWTIEQDGNWLQGLQTGKFTVQNLVGTIDGDEVRIRNSDNVPGDHLAFTFTGKVTDEKLSGSVYMIEYGTAKFTATRFQYKNERKKLSVPGGPPLAT